MKLHGRARLVASLELGLGTGSACTPLELDANYASLCKDPKVVAAVLAEMTKVGKAAKLKGFECAKAIHLEPKPFDVENGLLTPTFKLKRPVARDHFRPQIDELYAELAARPKRSKL